jgi:hypothetical protein
VIAILFLLGCLFALVLFMTSCKSHRFKTRNKAQKNELLLFKDISQKNRISIRFFLLY